MHMRDLISSTRIAIQTSIQLATDRGMIGLRVDGRVLTQYGHTTLEEAERSGRPIGATAVGKPPLAVWEKFQNRDGVQNEREKPGPRPISTANSTWSTSCRSPSRDASACGPRPNSHVYFDDYTVTPAD
jgi:hypothetical protein